MQENSLLQSKTPSEESVDFAESQHLHTPAECLNCETHLPDGVNFCQNCGQTAHVHRLDLHHLLHEVVHFLTHADKGIFYLIGKLATKPGVVVREFVSGRRKKYFSPLNFFLIVVGLFVFVQTTFRPMDSISMEAARSEVRKIPDPVVRERRLAKLNRVEAARNFMARYSNYINMAVTPVVALIFFLFYRRRGFNYTEHLIANLYFAGFNALFYIFIITPYLLLTKGKLIFFLGILAFLLWEAFYRAVGYYQFIQKKGKKSFFYALFVSVFAVALWYFFSTSMIKLYMNTGFK